MEFYSGKPKYLAASVMDYCTGVLTPDQTMKNRVIRSVKRGIRMVEGGYRALLK